MAIKNVNYLIFCLLPFISNENSQKMDNSQTTIKTPVNHLIHESSPYLLQHAHNPVNWYPWGDQALRLAKEQNKPLLISIGYAACHWCHVMEHESFSDSTIAEIMNQNFICIKVDREERPDVDKIYMDAVQLLTRQGGWPLNAFALPDGRPFYGGTYFQKQQWMSLLQQVAELYKTQYSDIEKQAQSVSDGLLQGDHLLLNPDAKTDQLSKTMYHNLFNNWQGIIDFTNGGFKGAPKFVLPVGWEFLMQYYFATGNKLAQEATLLTLRKIVNGGINDQLNGGFARYSVDDHWFAPHFEKMLYDNAQLLSLFAHAYQQTGDENLKATMLTLVQFLQNELQSHDGGFYSSINADSEGVEGAFYVWRYEELATHLGAKDLEFACQYFGITPHGNWEHGLNILTVSNSLEDIAKQTNQSVISIGKQLSSVKQKMVDIVTKRERPSTDDKVLTAWNALMLSGLVDAYSATGEDVFLNLAKQNAQFLSKNMIQPNGQVYRNFKNGKVSIPGFLDDYAFLADAFIKLYQITFDEEWLTLSKQITTYALVHFSSDKSPLLYYTSDESHDLIVRKTEVMDNVTPSSNAVMAGVLLKLSIYFEIPQWEERTKTMVLAVSPHFPEGGPYYSGWSQVLGNLVFANYQVVFSGKNGISRAREMQHYYQPFTLYANAANSNLPLVVDKDNGSEDLIYVCMDKTCFAPVKTVFDALGLTRE